MSGSVVCPSCGHEIDDADGVCAVCGFAVRLGAATRARAAVDAALDSAADTAVDGPTLSLVRRRGPAGWAPQAPSPPARISAPDAVSPPPSQISVDGLEVHWSSRFLRRPVRSAAAAAVAAAGVARVSAGGSTSAASRVAAGRPASAARELPGAVAEAAARARERRREPAHAPAARVSVPAGFDQVLGSDFRADSAISGAGPRDVRAPAAPARRASSGASGIALPSWWRGGTSAAPEPAEGRPASRSRPPVPRAGVVIGVLVLLFAGLVIFTGLAQHLSVQTGEPGSGGGSTTVTIATPLPGDLAAVQWELARLAAVMASPAARISVSRPSTAAQARAIRARLTTWRDGFTLTAHQSRVLDNAVVYARALSRWLTAPAEPGRHAAALSAWRVWRADDPLLRNP